MAGHQADRPRADHPAAQLPERRVIERPAGVDQRAGPADADQRTGEERRGPERPQQGQAGDPPVLAETCCGTGNSLLPLLIKLL